MAAKDLGPLDWRTPIVDGAGHPSPEFQRRWNQQRTNNGLIGFVATGSGAPSSVPQDGQEYVDIGATPWVLYVGDNGAWSTVGPLAFTDLADAPHAYTSAGDKLVKVTTAADGLEFASISAVLDLIDDTRGAVLYRGATAWAALAPGTAGEVLSTNGAGADPAWIPQSGGGGGWTLINTFAVAAQTEVDCLSVFSNTYDEYEIAVNGFVPNASGGDMAMQFGNASGPTWETSANYFWGQVLAKNNGGTPVTPGANSASTVSIFADWTANSPPTRQADARISVTYPTTTRGKNVSGTVAYSNSLAAVAGSVMGLLLTATAYDSFRLLFGNTITSGEVKVYGR